MNDGTEARTENGAAIASWMSGSSGRTMIDALIAEQQQLTAVERFARRHEEGELPAQARYYRDLIPVRGPHAGEQFAFAVDLDACSGCKGCVSACHALNGLDDDEVWREVGLLHGSSGAVSYQQTITTACHHCVEPACLEGCPVMAYEKDSTTGIVRHLDDQCIGCQYCVLKCPYDVPKYSVRRGIVRKCDMCHGRLSAGEAPACVQACPNEAISIRLVDKAAITAMSLPGRSLVPDAFPSDYTKPTTIYASARMRPANTRAADVHALRVEPAHWPLIGMTVLTQWATGIFAAVTLITFFANEPSDRIAATLSKTGFALLVTGLAISVLHLGRPAGAWRFFLGLRTSWMSREILAFGFFGAASTALAWWPDVARCLRVPGGNVTLFAPLVALLGIGSLFCSAMIYVDTRRAFWGSALTFPKFFGTAVTLGAGATACVLGDGARETAIGVAMVSFAALSAWEASHWFCALRSSNAPTHRSARTIWELQRPVLVARGAIVLAAISASVLAMNASGIMLALSLMVAAQLMERYLFFTAVVAPRMPGGVAS